MEARDNVLLLLKQHKCEKVGTSSRLHPIYRLPDGSKITLPASHKASDIRSWDNALSQLRVRLGISYRGRVAAAGRARNRRHKPGANYARTIEHEQAQVYDFRDKIRAALTGESPQPPELPVKTTRKQDPTKIETRQIFRKSRVVQRASERSGPVRVWTKEAIEAANRAAGAGKLDEFMRRHDQASSPESKLNYKEEEMSILEVSAIDSTVAELRTGIEAAQFAASQEQHLFEDLERQKEEAHQRRLAALDKANSMQETIASLELARESLVKVRPMLGLLVGKQTTEPVKRTRAAVGSAIESVVSVLEREQKPLTPRELHAGIRALPGFSTYTMNAVYALINVQKKKNGEAVIRSVGGGRYDLATRVTAAAPQT